jgi:demethylmenaquinone methyltransferase/2-methoxy-6-polyprenyl-1,4-benzoquinol methylase/phosphoethanolamine N-methyltransferase
MALGQTRRLRSLPLKLADLQPGESVLDVGCGTGDLALVAATVVGSAGRVWGIDAAPEMIEVATHKAAHAGRRAHNVRFAVQAVEALSFPDSSFDVVLSSLMMHHLPGNLKARALAEIRRVLKPGGRLLVIDFNPAASGKHGMLAGGPLLWVHKRAPRDKQTQPTAAPVGAGFATLAELAKHAGLTSVETGGTFHAWLGYLRAQAP